MISNFLYLLAAACASIFIYLLVTRDSPTEYNLEIAFSFIGIIIFAGIGVIFATRSKKKVTDIYHNG